MDKIKIISQISRLIIIIGVILGISLLIWGIFNGIDNKSFSLGSEEHMRKVFVREFFRSIF